MSRSSATFDPVRIGVVGLGGFGRHHAATIVTLVESSLVALVDVDEQRLEEAAGYFPGVAQWNNVSTALAEAGADAWVVASSTATHVPIAELILAANKPVLLEKPIAPSLDEAERLSPFVREHSSNLMLGHILLHNSEFVQLQREIPNRGSIAYIDCVRHRPVETMDGYPGENPFHLTMVHDLYIALVLMNRSEPVRISAQVHHAPCGRCDLALAQMQWSDGSLASFSASFMAPEGMGNEGFDRLEVFGDRWAARICANPRPLEMWDDCARWPMTLEMSGDQTSSTGMLAEELRCFCRVVRERQSVPMGATFEDALQIQRWLNRMEAASEESVGGQGNFV